MGIENLRLKQDIDMLASCNRERFAKIIELEMEISQLKAKAEDSQKDVKKSIITENENIYNCDFCEHVFPNKTLFKLHIVKDHELVLNNKTSDHRSTLLKDIEKPKVTEETCKKQHFCRNY